MPRRQATRSIRSTPTRPPSNAALRRRKVTYEHPCYFRQHRAEAQRAEARLGYSDAGMTPQFMDEIEYRFPEPPLRGRRANCTGDDRTPPAAPARCEDSRLHHRPTERNGPTAPDCRHARRPGIPRLVFLPLADWPALLENDPSRVRLLLRDNEPPSAPGGRHRPLQVFARGRSATGDRCRLSGGGGAWRVHGPRGPGATATRTDPEGTQHWPARRRRQWCAPSACSARMPFCTSTSRRCSTWPTPSTRPPAG